MIAYILGGPMDLTKVVVEKVNKLQFSSPDIQNMPEVARPPEESFGPHHIKTHHYRLHTMMSADVGVFYYEGTW